MNIGESNEQQTTHHITTRVCCTTPTTPKHKSYERILTTNNQQRRTPSSSQRRDAITEAIKPMRKRNDVLSQPPIRSLSASRLMRVEQGLLSFRVYLHTKRNLLGKALATTMVCLRKLDLLSILSLMIDTVCDVRHFSHALLLGFIWWLNDPTSSTLVCIHVLNFLCVWSLWRSSCSDIEILDGQTALGTAFSAARMKALKKTYHCLPWTVSWSISLAMSCVQCHGLVSLLLAHPSTWLNM